MPQEISTSRNLRGLSNLLLAFVALVVFLHWAQAIFIPITLAVVLTYTLTPVVNWMRRRICVPKPIGAAVVLVLTLTAIGSGLAYLHPQALSTLDLVPHAAEKLARTLRTSDHNPGTVAKIQKAASEIENAANTAASPEPVRPSKPMSEPPRSKVRDYLLIGTVQLATGAAQFVVIVALVYFLLIAGDSFRRTLMRISEGTLTSKKITIGMLDEIDSQIQRYLLVQVATSALLGVCAWLVLVGTGLANPAMWGLIGGVLHLVPYVGPAAFVALIALVSYVQFDTLQPVVTSIASITAINTLIGLFLVPWLTQKVGSLNAVTVFIALLVWGWLWGVWGLLLAVPIMVAIKAVCDRVEALQPVGAFLGHGVPGAERDEQAAVVDASRT